MTLEGNPWFVAKDVCDALGYAESNRGNILLKLNKEEVTLKRIQSSTRSLSLVSEAGLYKLLMRSDKPQAKPFQDWVTKEVLPSIRKTGSYSTHKEPQQLPLLDKPKGAPVGDRLEAIGVLLKDTVDALLGIISSQAPKEKPTEISQGGPRGFVWEETYLRGIRWVHCADAPPCLQ